MRPTHLMRQPAHDRRENNGGKVLGGVKIDTAVPLLRREPGDDPAVAGNDGDSARPTRKRRVNNATIMPKPLKISTKPCSRVNIDQMKIDQK